MENSVKKKKSKKGLRKRVGIIAVGGLSLVLTVCLSVGATLAWFAGSTWASKSLYMGGPVYVEMAGRGHSGETNPDDPYDGKGDGTDANWVGGNGNLDIQAAAGRKSGTAQSGEDVDYNDILLPGQKVQIYSQARVYSTAQTSTVDDDLIANNSSGSNPTNTSNVNTGTTTFRNEKGRVTTTTTSVLRARFSVEVEFDPGMGFNNFTDSDYRDNYPVQSGTYTGKCGDDFTSKKSWQEALSATDSEAVFEQTNPGTPNNTPTYKGRRDGVAKAKSESVNWSSSTTDLTKLKTGEEVSIYKWKYVSSSVYNRAGDNGSDPKAANGIKMGAPFDGSVQTAGGYGYYGVWITEKATGDGATGYVMTESDAFYKARCNAYINTYVEAYQNEYGDVVERKIGDSVTALEDALNGFFIQLINDSSDHIHAGETGGFTINPDTQKMIFDEANKKEGEKASWLYIDPSIGNDTNTDEISTSVGGWWYLVEDNGEAVGSSGDGGNKITAVYDSVKAGTESDESGHNVIIEKEDAITRKNASASKDDTDVVIEGSSIKEGATKYSRLDAKLYEIKPTQDLGEAVTSNGDNVTKVVSNAYPFVNGAFALPSDALTNVFANAKITFKISFQALQAFFPYTTSIDKVSSSNAVQLFGKAKALSIRNAIPIYNEAFDYQESNGLDYSGML